jgi:hypothetical protein
MIYLDERKFAIGTEVQSEHRAPALGQAQGHRCRWCSRPFTSRRSGGSAQRFCSARCRHAFGTAARRLVMQAVEEGTIPVEALRANQTSAHAVGEASERGGTSSPSEEAEQVGGLDARA